jgi:2-keto-4-pentenoate hydratase
MNASRRPSPPANAAAELIRQHADGERFAALGGDLAPASASEAYAIQQEYVDELLALRQTTLAGFKIAITTPAMRDMVGFQDSVSGRLFRDQIHLSGPTIRARDYSRLIVEFEIAFELRSDLPLRASPWSGSSILEHVGCAYPALEIADDRRADYAGLKEAVLSLIADNAWNQGLVLGGAVTTLDAAALQAVEGIGFVDGIEIGRGTGRDVLGHPLDALAWLANHLAARGLTLASGNIVTTGSLFKSHFAVAGQRISFRLPGFGEVSLQVE